MMFNMAKAPFPSLWANMRKLLSARNVPPRVHQRYRIIGIIANTIFVDREENSRAVGLAKCIHNEPINSNKETSTLPKLSDYDNNFDKSEQKKAYSITIWLKGAEKKFSGNLPEYWEGYQDE